MMKHTDPVGALGGLAFGHNVGHQVVGGVLMHGLHFPGQVPSQNHIRNREGDNSWVLLHKEIVS